MTHDPDYAKMLNDFSSASMESTAAVPTFFLDLDQCTLYGEDFNDFITLLQATNQPQSSIKTIMGMLVSPAMINTMRKLLAKHPNARVCLYTKKSGFIRDRGIPRHNLKAGEAYYPPETTLEEVLASEDPKIPVGMIQPYERLFMARTIIQEVLALASPPDLIITCMRKSVVRACTTLLQPPMDHKHAFLWDDNDEIKDDYHVIPVPKYNAVPPNIADLIHSLLETMIEGRKLDKTKDFSLIKFFSTGLPNHSCYNRLENSIYVHADSDYPVEWNIPANN